MGAMVAEFRAVIFPPLFLGAHVALQYHVIGYIEGDDRLELSLRFVAAALFSIGFPSPSPCMTGAGRQQLT